MTARLHNWQSRLQACLAERWALPFEWGKQDCALFAADCVDACTGVDPAADLRGKYSTVLTAQRLVDAMGGLAGLAEARLGPEVVPLMAQPGDVGLVLSAGRESLAVCIGGAWYAPGVAGIEALPMSKCLRAWRLLKEEVQCPQ